MRRTILFELSMAMTRFSCGLSGTRHRRWNVVASVVAVVIVCGCTGESSFDADAYRQARQQVIEEARAESSDKEKLVDFELCLSDWIHHGFAKNFWGGLHAKYDISHVYLSWETGNYAWPFYDCKAIIESSEGVFLAKIHLTPDRDSSTTECLQINNDRLITIMSNLDKAISKGYLDSYLPAQIIFDDATCGIMIFQEGPAVQSFLIYGLPVGEDIPVASVINYVDSVFSTGWDKAEQSK